jgi:hypothetical protein
MTKWLTSLVMIAVLGGVLAGMPLHADKQECGMGGMNSQMDCCATALTQGDAPEVMAARLCCALDCSQSGPTAPTNTVRCSPLAIILLHPAALQPRPALPTPRLPAEAARGLLTDSQPTYIRHLALLI